MTDLQSLLARVEGADGPDEDAAVRAVFSHFALVFAPKLAASDIDHIKWWARVCTWLDVGAYESAALALVERVLPGWRVAHLGKTRESEDAGRYTGGWSARLLCVLKQMRFNLAYGHAKTPALALLAAMLRALSDKAAS